MSLSSAARTMLAISRSRSPIGWITSPGCDDSLPNVSYDSFVRVRRLTERRMPPTFLTSSSLLLER